MPLDAVRIVSAEDAGVCTVDIKRCVYVEKLPGGEINDIRVLSGVMLNKDIAHPQLHRLIHKPRIVLLDCPLSITKGESRQMSRYRKRRFLRGPIKLGRNKSMRWWTAC